MKKFAFVLRTPDETVHYAVEKTERSLERVTNEKMLALGEYSDSVLSEIDKNHKEVMFLYDMLSDKHAALENTVKEVNSTVKQAESTAKDVKISLEETQKSAESLRKKDEAVFPAPVTQIASDAAGEQDAEGFHELETPVLSMKEAEPKILKEPKKPATRTRKKAEDMPADMSTITAGVTGGNNNEKILAMHRQGRSNMAIARELGLGVGEVKLVIDLFEK